MGTNRSRGSSFSRRVKTNSPPPQIANLITQSPNIVPFLSSPNPQIAGVKTNSLLSGADYQKQIQTCSKQINRHLQFRTISDIYTGRGTPIKALTRGGLGSRIRSKWANFIGNRTMMPEWMKNALGKGKYYPPDCTDDCSDIIRAWGSFWPG